MLYERIEAFFNALVTEWKAAFVFVYILIGVLLSVGSDLIGYKKGLPETWTVKASINTLDFTTL